jgi:hypothetical protein
MTIENKIKCTYMDITKIRAHEGEPSVSPISIMFCLQVLLNNKNNN